MADLNRQQILGRIGGLKELRYTASGKAVMNISVAVNKEYTPTGSSEKKKETCWFEVILWGKTAEFCQKYAQKGDRVYIEAEFANRKWVDKEGKDRYSPEFNVGANGCFNLLTGKNNETVGAPGSGTRQETGRPNTPASDPLNAPLDDSDLPF